MFVVATLLAAGAHAQELSAVKAEVLAISDGAKALLASTMSERKSADMTELTRRLNDGQVFYLQGEYSRAAIVLMDLIKRPGIEGHPAYSDAMYYLADSLFMMATTGLLPNFYEFTAKGEKRRRDWATGRLLQICGRRSDVDFCESNRQRAFQDINASSMSSLKYALGKALYKNEQINDAERVFQLVQLSEAEWSRSQYFIGVLNLKRQDYEKAKAFFARVVDRGVKEPSKLTDSKEKEVYNLARLAVARVLYEQTKLMEARDQYNQVDTDSRAYDAAHYESIWLSIKQEITEITP